MRTALPGRCLVAGLLSLMLAAGAAAQSTTVGLPSTVIPIAGELRTALGEPRTGVVTLVLSLYDNEDDLSPRWVEQHVITLDDAGRYEVHLGSTQDQGLPLELFSGASVVRWVGVTVDNEPELPRMGLLAVPYAAKAGTADTLAGKTASDFVLTTDLSDQVKAALKSDDGRQSEGGDVVTNAVTQNYLQKGDGAGGTTDSNIFESAGQVGVGTATPVGRFHVCCTDVLAQFETTNAGSNAILRVVAPTTGQSRFDFGDSDSPTIGRLSYNHPTDAFTFFTNNTTALTIDSSQRVGIGTSSPDSNLNVYAASGAAKITLAAVDGVNDPFLDFETNNNEWTFGVRKSDSNKFVVANNNDISANQVLTLTTGGNVGIGTTSPTARLHVAGNASVSGNVTVDGNIAAKYQDVAEWVEAREPLEAGSIVVIDAAAKNRVMASARSYDTSVAGAVSAQPGVVLGEPGDGKVLVAQSGRVRIKADARYGAIRPGDLLVTSPTKGHAMRSRPVNLGGHGVHRPGTLIGKALEALPRGQGEILVLLTLQ